MNTFQQTLQDGTHGPAGAAPQQAEQAPPGEKTAEQTQAEKDALATEHARARAALEGKHELDAAAHHVTRACFHCDHAQGDADHTDSVECHFAPPHPGLGLDGDQPYHWPRVPRHGWCSQFLHAGSKTT